MEYRLNSSKFRFQLADLGFYEIDALDASEGMLEVAKGLNRYRKYFNVLFPPPVDTIAASKCFHLVFFPDMGSGQVY